MGLKKILLAYSFQVSAFCKSVLRIIAWGDLAFITATK
jgi:hypothetical protein